MKQGWTPFEDITEDTAAVLNKPVPGLDRVYKNAIFIVQRYLRASTWGEMTMLLVNRHDGEPVRSWASLQRIKAELVGPERTAVEVFPPASEAAPQHCALWVLPEGFKLPFGLHGEYAQKTRLTLGEEMQRAARGLAEALRP